MGLDSDEQLVRRDHPVERKAADLLEASVRHVCSRWWEINPMKNQGSITSAKRMMAP